MFPLFACTTGPPSVIERTVDGVKCEPFEAVEVTVPNEYTSAVVDLLNKRKGDMLLMGPCEGSLGLTVLKFVVPTRGAAMSVNLFNVGCVYMD